MTTPSQPLINIENKRDLSPKGTLEQRKARNKEPYCTIMLDSQHTVQSALTMESPLLKPKSRLPRKTRQSEKSGVSGKQGGDDTPEPLPRNLESGKNSECTHSDLRARSASVQEQSSTGRGRASELGSKPLETDKQASCGDTHATVVSSDISGQDLNRKKAKKKTRSNSKRLKKLRSADGPSTRCEERRRRSRSETPSNSGIESSHELPSVEGKCRIRRPTLSPNTSRRGLQRAASVPNIVDVILPDESRLPNRITRERSKSVVPSQPDFDRYPQVSRLSPILSVASSLSALSSPVRNMVDAMRGHLEIFSLNHAPSQTEEVIARMRIELDAFDAKQWRSPTASDAIDIKRRRPSTSSAQTRSTFVEMSIGDRVNTLNVDREWRPHQPPGAWIPSTGHIVNINSSNACSSTSVGSASAASAIQPNVNSAAVKTAGRRKIGQSIVRRLLRSVSPRRPPNNIGKATLSPNQHHDDDDTARGVTDPTQTHRVQLRDRRHSMILFENGEPHRDHCQDRRNSADQKNSTATFNARDAVIEMEQIQQQLERDMDRLHQKWDDLQRKRRLLRSGLSFDEIS